MQITYLDTVGRTGRGRETDSILPVYGISAHHRLASHVLFHHCLKPEVQGEVDKVKESLVAHIFPKLFFHQSRVGTAAPGGEGVADPQRQPHRLCGASPRGGPRLSLTADRRNSRPAPSPPDLHAEPARHGRPCRLVNGAAQGRAAGPASPQGRARRCGPTPLHPTPRRLARYPFGATFTRRRLEISYVTEATL